MINANELRKGNWVMLAGAYWQIGFAEEIDVHHFEPIELSPEILEKAGFESGGHYNKMWLYLPNRTCSITYRRDTKLLSLTIDDSDNFPCVSSFEMGHITSVHQLQNLYFGLTGEELMIEDFNVEQRSINVNK